MKFRFSVEMDFPQAPRLHNVEPEGAQKLLKLAIEMGMKDLGWGAKDGEGGRLFSFEVEKLRARAIDLDKPVEQQE